MSNEAHHGRSLRRSTLLRIIVVVLLLSTAIVCLRYVPKSSVLRVLTWIQELGVWGPVLLGILYIPAAVLLVPGTILTLFAGFAFDLVPAIIAVSLGSTAGAAAAFLVGRKLARGIVERKVTKYPQFTAIDRAVAAEGFKIVLLIRLSPIIPFNVSNYAFGLTKISFLHYVLASWIGMFPATVAYVYLGRTAGSLTELTQRRPEDGSGLQWTLFVVGLVATVVVTIFVTRIAKRALNEAIEKANAESKSDSSGV